MFAFAHRRQPAAVILANGEDVLDYLQSQWTVNLSLPGESRAVYGLRLSRKGHVLADAFLLREGKERFRIVSYDCPAEELIALLKENVVADDVEFVDRDGIGDGEPGRSIDHTLAAGLAGVRYTWRHGNSHGNGEGRARLGDGRESHSDLVVE